MKSVKQNKSSQLKSEKAVQWVLADCGDKDLWKMLVLSLEWNNECVMDGKSGQQVEDELENVTSSGEWFMQGWRSQTGSWFQRCGDA